MDSRFYVACSESVALLKSLFFNLNQYFQINNKTILPRECCVVVNQINSK